MYISARFLTQMHAIIATLMLFTMCGCNQKPGNSAATNLLLNASCIFEVNNFSQIEEIAHNLCGKTLIVFANKNVITTPNAGALRDGYNHELKNRLKMLSKCRISAADYRTIFSGILILEGNRLIDSNAHKVISNLQKRRNTKVLMCSSEFHGAYGVIARYEDLIRRELLTFGVDFSKNWQSHDAYVMKNVAGKNSAIFKNEARHPLFCHGMLFTNFASKGAVLADFLDHFDLRPDVLVFVDAKIQNLIEVKKILDSRNTRVVLVNFSVMK